MRVLLIEDHLPDVWLIRRQFDKIGVELFVVGDGQSALNRIETESFDLVLLDLNLPILNGFEILNRLRMGGNQVPVVVLTSSKVEADIVKAYQAGANAYVVKPTDKPTFDDLLQAINDFWQHNHQAGQ